MGQQMKTKIIQIAVMPNTEENYTNLVALCEDGTLWIKRFVGNKGWVQFPLDVEPE